MLNVHLEVGEVEDLKADGSPRKAVFVYKLRLGVTRGATGLKLARVLLGFSKSDVSLEYEDTGMMEGVSEVTLLNFSRNL